MIVSQAGASSNRDSQIIHFMEGRQIQAGCTCPENRIGIAEVGALPTPSATSCSSIAERSPDKRENAERYRAGRPAFALRASARQVDSIHKHLAKCALQNGVRAQAPWVAEAD